MRHTPDHNDGRRFQKLSLVSDDCFRYRNSYTAFEPDGYLCPGGGDDSGLPSGSLQGLS